MGIKNVPRVKKYKLFNREHIKHLDTRHIKYLQRLLTEEGEMSGWKVLNIKPLKADIVAFFLELLLGDNVAVELRVSAEFCAPVPGVRHRTGTYQWLSGKMYGSVPKLHDNTVDSLGLNKYI